MIVDRTFSALLRDLWTSRLVKLKFSSLMAVIYHVCAAVALLHQKMIPAVKILSVKNTINIFRMVLESISQMVLSVLINGQ